MPTQTTTEKPSARAAKALFTSGTISLEKFTEIIARETGCDELLEAAKAALVCLCPTGMNTRSDIAIKKLEAAIAKAEGGGQ